MASDTDQTARRARLDGLKKKLAARTGRDGKALQGYKENVEQIREQITNLEKVIAQVEAHEHPADDAPLDL